MGASRPLRILRVLCAKVSLFLEEQMRLENKIGIVTAAASGMGRAGALRFAKEGAAVGVDDFARDIVKRTANAFGGLDFVWDHVGHPGPAAIEGIDMKDFELAIDLNLR